MLNWLMIVAVGVAEPPAKPLTKPIPAIKEPDWAVWKEVDAKEKAKAHELWKQLLSHRIDQPYASRQDEQAAMNKVDATYAALDGMSDATCASGVELIRNTKDDWERLTVAITVRKNGKEKADEIMRWAMAVSKKVDPFYDSLFSYSFREIAARKNPDDLPALLLLLREEKGRNFYLQIHESLFLVFGVFGRESIPYVRGLLSHEDALVRRNAAMVLSGFMDEASIPKFKDMLKNGDIGVSGAAFALGEMGVQESITDLCELLKNKDANTRFWAAYGLFELGHKDAIPALKAALEQETDNQSKREMRVAIDHLENTKSPYPADTKVLSPEELKIMIENATKSEMNGFNFAKIAISATKKDIPDLVDLRLHMLKQMNKAGIYDSKSCHRVIKYVARKPN